ncbi:MAG: hypothetical protein E7168_01070 [Firmicutes bacterium]|nr:hypothetical protein [Bacillota bacterium]
MFRNCCYDRQNEVNNNQFTAENMAVDIDIDMMNNNQAMPAMATPIAGTVQSPIIEPMQERVVNRTIMHEVPHVCPMRTRIVNHHIYRHTYRPSHSCCEENVCSQIQCGSCCNFR